MRIIYSVEYGLLRYDVCIEMAVDRLFKLKWCASIFDKHRLE